MVQVSGPKAQLVETLIRDVSLLLEAAGVNTRDYHLEGVTPGHSGILRIVYAPHHEKVNLAAVSSQGILKALPGFRAVVFVGVQGAGKDILSGRSVLYTDLSNAEEDPWTPYWEQSEAHGGRGWQQRLAKTAVKYALKLPELYGDFATWLSANTERRNPVGDLARDAAHDADFRQPENTLAAYQGYLENKLACYGALTALEEAWAEYTRQRPSFTE